MRMRRMPRLTTCIAADNPKALIARPDRYEPGLGTTTQDFVNHYGTAMLPAQAGRNHAMTPADDLPHARREAR